jgi:enolase
MPKVDAATKAMMDALKAAGVPQSTISKASAKVKAESFLIESLKAREILDSRGNPTVEVDLTTKGGISVRAAVPSGASTGIHEAVELRDGVKTRYLGKGVTKAVDAVNTTLNKELKGMSVGDQRALDAKMCEIDGTPNKGKLGANAILGVSLAAAKAAAEAKGIPLYKHFADLAGNNGAMVLPVPCFNVINGGSHAGNKLAFQEYFIIPVGAKTFREAMQIGAECYHNLKGIIKKKYGGDATLIGDEGGFAPPCDAKGGVELIMEAIEKSGYKDKCSIGMDVAASEFKVEGKDCYDLGTWYPDKEKTPDLKMTGAQLGDFYKKLCDEYPIITIEDPFDQDDWAAWTGITSLLGENTQVVGDDLTVTNTKRVKRAITEKACNALLLKVNQIGSVTESIDAVRMCKQSSWGVMCSHRSGETEDTTIADLAVGLCTGQIKTGAPCRSDRNAKYNQLMRIEDELGSRAVYAGKLWRQPKWMAHSGTLIFSRHGESEWNVANRFTGWVDVDLSAKGLQEAKAAGELLKAEGIKVDIAFTSYLKRAIKTLDIALEAADQLSVPVKKTWRLNERMYGGLTGLDKKETVTKHGADQVQIWRRSFDIPPPEIEKTSPYYPGNDPKYADLKDDEIPTTECLKDTIARVMPYWEKEIVPELKAGKTVFVAAHGNSIRAIVKFLEGISDDEIPGLEIPTGTPLLYTLGTGLKPFGSDEAMPPLKCGIYLGYA